MPDRPSHPRRPAGDRSPGRRRGDEDDALVFDARRGNRSSEDESVRAIPTGKRERRPRTSEPTKARPSSEPTKARPSSAARGADRRPVGSDRPAAGGSGRPPTEGPRTRVMPAGTPPSRAPGQSRTPGRSGGGPPHAPGSGGPGRPERPRGNGPRRPRRRPLRTAMTVLLVLALVWAGGMAWAVTSSWHAVDKVDATPDGQRPSGSKGRNVLLVGSDSREGLTREERNRLGTGSDTGGARTDSILVLHTGGGDSTLLSIPRDSYVDIPGQGMNKINAAFSMGGPKLLVETIEQNTGLKLDGYMEIGFGGFAHVVDAVGGVDICVKNDMDDEKAHINLKKGCQTLDGKNALGYVRARYSDPEGDLGRARRQREFLGALSGKVMTPANMLLPWRVHSLGTSTGSALTIGDDDSLFGTARALWAFRGISQGNGNSVAVPVGNNNLPTPAGSAIQWDEARSQQLFDDLREDRPLSIQPDDG